MRLAATCVLPVLLSLGGALPAGADSPSPDLIKLLRETGICPPAGECTLTAGRMEKMRQLATKTEQHQPVPRQVTPGVTAGAAPADAIALFDGRNLQRWVSTNDKTPARWPVRGGGFTVDKSLGNIETRQHFGSYQLHLEWLVPKDIAGTGQSRGNSGLFLASTGPDHAGYELQILDSWNNPTYVNGQAASIYKQAAPLVNASRRPGEWQSYDVVWTAPVFAADGTLHSPAYLTAFHNGVLVQNHVRLAGETSFIGKPFYRPHGRAAIKLQAHGDPSAALSFRNIWLRELDDRTVDMKTDMK